jgi:glycosyltransferase involved in cell wall biosynthesis
MAILKMMHICITCIEFFGDSVYGGFGRATRCIGSELAKHGCKVSVVVPRRSPERPDRYELDGMTVHQISAKRLDRAIRLLRNLDADVYHSQDTSILTALARLAAPKAAHVITFRDPMDRHDWAIETDYAGMPRLGWSLYRWFITNPLIVHALRRMDSCFCAAEFLIPKTQTLYGLREQPVFLPSPVPMPVPIAKADRPTVCFIGRWEGRKRVELFFELARQHPQIECLAIGGARDHKLDQALRKRYGEIANLQMPGVLDQFQDAAWSQSLGRSWILVNTSAREGLPTTFVEAAAHRTAILSFTDPDGFASLYGCCVGEGELKDGLSWLLEDGRWRRLGEAGRAGVESVFAPDAAIAAHLKAYEQARAKADQRCGP